MVNLLNPALRPRDIRKLVKRHLHNVEWESGVDETSEWIIASTKNLKQYQKLISWLYSKNIEASRQAICIDAAWSELSQISWDAICSNPEYIFAQKDVLIVSSDRLWVIEYSSLQEIFRFGRWVRMK